MGKWIVPFILWKDKKREIPFREWVEQEERKEKILKAVRERSDDFPMYLIEFVATALRVSPSWIEEVPWNMVVGAFYTILIRFPVVEIPITRPYKKNDTESKEDWDYDGRSWYFYSNLIASRYGWTFEYISQLKVLDALATIQEILTQDQLDKEFYYSLSELAYPYNASTKKSSFQPMKRPMWMMPKIKEVPRFKMPASLLPIGTVDYRALPEELRPEATLN
jgi:hypothetical protein